VHPPERMDVPVQTRSEAETVVMDDLDQEGRRKAWNSED
jgi:hypothetical protein